MATIPFPVGPTCYTEGWRIENASRTGGPAVLGSQQFVSSPAGRWRGKLSFHCITDDDYREVDGFLAALDGSANTFLLGPSDWRGRPWNLDPFGFPITPARRGGASFEADPLTTSALSFSLNAAAAMNATSLSIRRTRGGLLKRGQYLSIAQRLHIVTALAGADTGLTGSGSPVGIQVRPWLRADYPAGTVVEFAAPTGSMRLAPESAALLERTAEPLADLTLDVIEAF